MNWNSNPIPFNLLCQNHRNQTPVRCCVSLNTQVRHVTVPPWRKKEFGLLRPRAKTFNEMNEDCRERNEWNFHLHSSLNNCMGFVSGSKKKNNHFKVWHRKRLVQFWKKNKTDLVWFNPPNLNITFNDFDSVSKCTFYRVTKFLCDMFNKYISVFLALAFAIQIYIFVIASCQ